LVASWLSNTIFVLYTWPPNKIKHFGHTSWSFGRFVPLGAVVHGGSHKGWALYLFGATAESSGLKCEGNGTASQQ